MQDQLKSLGQGKRFTESHIHSMAFNRPNEAGMYVIGKVEDAEIKWLIDTGATVRLLAKRVFDEIKKTHDILTTEEPHQDIMIAEGKPFKLNGTVTLNVTLGSSRCQRKLIIEDITVDGILGLDFYERIHVPNRFEYIRENVDYKRKMSLSEDRKEARMLSRNFFKILYFSPKKRNGSFL